MDTDELEIQKLLINNTFLEAVLSKTASLLEWEIYVATKYPDKIGIAEKARDIILCLNKDKEELSDDEFYTLKFRILRSLPEKLTLPLSSITD